MPLAEKLPRNDSCGGSILAGDGCQKCFFCIQEARVVVLEYRKTPLVTLDVPLRNYIKHCSMVLILKFDHIWFADFVKRGK